MSLCVSIRHRFPGFDLNVAFEAPPGVTAIFGQSGSGKTTVVNALAGLLRPQAGRISIGGRELLNTADGYWLPPHRRRIGYVFQEGRLFPHLNVRQNLLYGRWFARGRKENAELSHIVELLGIEPLLERRPARLSGGEKQRVAFGRALLSAPQLLLMDEPLAALDEARKLEIMPYIERLRDETAIPIVYVSHSVAEVARLATTIVILKDGQAVRCGPANEVLGDPAVAPGLGVRGAGAVLTAGVVAHHADGLTELALGPARLFLPRIQSPVGARIRIRIAAQDVMLARSRSHDISALNVLEGVVHEVRRGVGPGAMVTIGVGAQTVLSRITRRSCEALQLAPGSPCFAIMKTVAVAPDDIGT